MNSEFLDEQQDLIELLEEHGYDVEQCALEEYTMDEPTSARVEIAVGLELEDSEDDSNPFRVQ